MPSNLPLEEQNIIKILGIESLPDERKIALVEKISELVQKRLFVRVLDALSAEKQAELGNLLDQNDQAALSEFLKKEAADFPNWVEEEVVKMKEELAELAGNA